MDEQEGQRKAEEITMLFAMTAAPLIGKFKEWSSDTLINLRKRGSGASPQSEANATKVGNVAGETTQRYYRGCGEG